jgi:hypothetical protein
MMTLTERPFTPTDLPTWTITRVSAECAGTSSGIPASDMIGCGWRKSCAAALLPRKAAAVSLEHQRSEAEEEVLKQIVKALGADKAHPPTK